MNLKVAVQVDKNLDFNNDSTIYLTREAQNRNYEVFYYNTEDLYSTSEKVYALSHYVEVLKDRILVKEHVKINLDDMDIVLMRQDPPFNMRYITTTYLLEKCNALVINNPKSVRNSPEKIFSYNDFTLPTLITENIEIIKEFYLEHNDVVLKPLYSFGGKNVMHATSLEGLESIAKMMMMLYNEPILVQKFFPGVLSSGDKRVFLLDGVVLGAYARFSSTGFRVNTVLGGFVKETSLSVREEEICALVGKNLAKDGIILAGIDIIGECYLSEINVTSPTGLVTIGDMLHRNVAVDCWNCFESKL